MEWERDQDGEAAEQGYSARRRSVRETSSEEELICRYVARKLFDQLSDLIVAFETGDPCDVNQFSLKAKQAALNMGIALELRERELVPA